MLADLAIIPIGNSPHTSRVLAEILKTIKDSGLPYQLTPSSTCIEGSWDEIMALVKRCHQIAYSDTPHVLTLLRMEEGEKSSGKLKSNLESVEEKAGESFEKKPAA
ncbi:MAG: MTH1187 family thiamine-binding protein [Rariglobus sp.]